MKKLFPDMLERPGTASVVTALGFSFFPFFLLPLLLGGLTIDVQEKLDVLVWFDIGYHAFNAIVMVLIYGVYMKEAFFNVRFQTKSFFGTVGIAAGAMILAGYLVGRMIGFTENTWLAFSIFPVTEVEMTSLSGDIVYAQPLIGTFCMALLTPFAISGMYYATAFAPICVNRPWLAYIMVAVYLLVPRLLYALNWWLLSEEVMLYLVQLPIHLIACWSYQKTDTIWAPICSLAIVNLVTGLGLVLLYML